MAQSARTQLVELLSKNPALLAEVRGMVGEDAGDSVEDEARSTIFDGESDASEAPLQSKSGKSLKYEVLCFIDGVEDGPKALVVAYIPPELATKSILVTVVAEGSGTAGRERSSQAS